MGQENFTYKLVERLTHVLCPTTWLCSAVCALFTVFSLAESSSCFATREEKISPHEKEEP